ncbi:hypothetical protein E3N88_03568 [Mikania micrantha]|uniref:Uncharacterized protein n=1 Tax=Mikania micrantha TaxID=192012 RepID=A0A5N6Q730_9ASTR|nr:hypothetical protein E3N88_03568 [Mikania micrantha]
MQEEDTPERIFRMKDGYSKLRGKTEREQHLTDILELLKEEQLYVKLFNCEVRIRISNSWKQHLQWASIVEQKDSLQMKPNGILTTKIVGGTSETVRVTGTA